MHRLTETEWIWRDGEFIKWKDATMHVLAHSMQFGSSAFEGVRCYQTPRGPAIFRLVDHLERLRNSCKIYRMDLRFSTADLVAACRELVTRNGLDACYLRPMVLRGYGAAGMVPTASPVEVYLPCWPWGAYLGPEALERGVDACVSTWTRVAPNTLPAAAKMAGNYLSGMLVKMEALGNGFSEGIALDVDGRVSEGSGQNVFLIKNGIVHTAPLNGTLLPGITRDTIVTLAREAGYPVKEEAMSREMLYLADEVFFCGTAVEVTPVRSVDKLVVGDGRPGPITRDLQRRYLDLVSGRATDQHGWLTFADEAVEPKMVGARAG
ncbi:MAG: branched-chain amino acid transaminase [Gemmatimonadales bacterium]